MIRRQAWQLPQDDSFGDRPTFHFERCGQTGMSAPPQHTRPRNVSTSRCGGVFCCTCFGDDASGEVVPPDRGGRGAFDGIVRRALEDETDGRGAGIVEAHVVGGISPAVARGDGVEGFDRPPPGIEREHAVEGQVQTPWLVHRKLAEGIRFIRGFRFEVDASVHAEPDEIGFGGLDGQPELSFLQVVIPPSWRLAADRVDEVAQGETSGEEIRRAPGLALPGIPGYQRPDLLLCKPREVDVVPRVHFVGISREVADRHFERQSVFRIGPSESRIDGIGIGNIVRRAPGRALSPPFQALLEHFQERGGIPRVDGPQQFSLRGTRVQSLPGGRGFGAPAIMALLRDEAEELALGVFLRLGVAAVVRNGNVGIVEDPDNFGMGENGLTARDAIVSDTAERVAVHRPDEHRSVYRGRATPGRPEVCLPADIGPPHFLGFRPDQRGQRFNRFGTWLPLLSLSLHIYLLFGVHTQNTFNNHTSELANGIPGRPTSRFSSNSAVCLSLYVSASSRRNSSSYRCQPVYKGISLPEGYQSRAR